jgi:hypothetical protein
MCTLEIPKAEPEVMIQVLERHVTEQLSNLCGVGVVLQEVRGAGASNGVGCHAVQAEFARSLANHSRERFTGHGVASKI